MQISLSQRVQNSKMPSTKHRLWQASQVLFRLLLLFSKFLFQQINRKHLPFQFLSPLLKKRRKKKSLILYLSRQASHSQTVTWQLLLKNQFLLYQQLPRVILFWLCLQTQKTKKRTTIPSFKQLLRLITIPSIKLRISLLPRLVLSKLKSVRSKLHLPSFRLLAVWTRVASLIPSLQINNRHQ